MSTTIDNTFITQWTAEVHHNFQQLNSNLRGAVRTVNNVVGEAYKFPVIGTGSATKNKARHADLQPMDVSHSIKTATLSNWHGVEWIDDLDQFKTNADYRREYLTTVTGAINRGLEEEIVTAMATTTNSATAGAMDTDLVAELHKELTKNKVPMGDRYLIIHYGALEDMLNDAKIASNDYLSKEAFTTGFVKGVMGFNVILMEDADLLPVDTASKHTCFAFHKSALGLAIGKDISLRVDYRSDKDLWQVMGKLSAGAVAVDPAGIISVEVDD
ncbi:phage capsid protein [Pacificispira sp.]|uniref:phage capsid protein n=1 Tax=Pacificispira sp. TaxID=2888761 RepID=UPI003BAA9257